MRARRIILILIVVFFVFTVFTNPTRAADIVVNIWELVLDGFSAITRFFTSLANR